MSTYETAPSTLLLATHCACCNRPLRDAVSVERGVGPDCAEKYGYAEAQGAADWAAVPSFLMTPIEASFNAAATDLNAHKCANILVHYAATLSRNARGKVVSALANLGFKTLALAVAKGAGEVVEVVLNGDRYNVRTPYSAEFVEYLKGARIGAAWDKTIVTGAKRPGAWTVPANDAGRKGLFAVLKSTFAGATLVSAKGITTIALASQEGPFTGLSTPGRQSPSRGFPFGLYGASSAGGRSVSLSAGSRRYPNPFGRDDACTERRAANASLTPSPRM